MTSNPHLQAQQAITAALERALPDQADLDWSHSLSTEAGLDSVQVMNLVMEIEDELDLSVPVDLLSEVNTLNELAQHLAVLLERRS